MPWSPRRRQESNVEVAPTIFEELCGWHLQTEFVYLAPQNTQAALIQGMTLHAFANIRIKAKGQGGERERGPDQFVQYQRLRWLALDEISTVGLDAQATRTKGTWKNNGRGEACLLYTSPSPRDA